MRIAIVNTSDRTMGGAESYLGALTPALLGAGHDVFFLHEQHGDPQRPAFLPKTVGGQCCIAAVGLDAAVAQLQQWRADVLFVQTVSEPYIEARLLDIAPAVFFAHAYYGTCISGSKTLRFPVARPCTRTFGPACLLLFYPRRCGGLSPATLIADYARGARRLEGLRRYRTVVTFSEHMRNEYLKHGLQPDHVVRLPAVSPSGETSATAHAGSVEASSLQAADAVRLCFAGRIERLKGLHLLIAALPYVRERLSRTLHVTIAGDGPEGDRCRGLAQRVQAKDPAITIDFLGWTSQARCAEVVSKSHVLVMPSIWPEPFGFAGADAVRAGVKVAAFAVGAIPEWLTEGETGSMAPANPPTARGLAAAILRSVRLAANPRPRLSAPIADDSMERHVKELLQVLEAARQSPPPTSSLPNAF